MCGLSEIVLIRCVKIQVGCVQ